MNVLVTGGAGYIGSHTVVELIQAGHRAVIVDDLSNAKAEVIDRIETITGTRPAFYQLDCKNKDGLRAVFSAHKRRTTAESANVSTPKYSTRPTKISACLSLISARIAGSCASTFSKSNS